MTDLPLPMAIMLGRDPCHPKLARGQVWCRKCGHSEMVNAPGALANGWPKCCGETMTIDAPDERKS